MDLSFPNERGAVRSDRARGGRLIADLPDANVWISLTSDVHSGHRRAKEYWLNEAEGPVSFCRTTALGLVRVLSGRHSVGGVPLTFMEAWHRYENWRLDPQVVLLGEPSGVEERFARFVEASLVTSKNSTDAYLAAFALAGGLRLVSFDRDFERFPGLDLLRL